MPVEVDQPRHDEQPAHIKDLGISGGEVMPDFGYLSVAEADIGRLVVSARRIDDAAASEDQILHMRVSDKNGSLTPFDGLDASREELERHETLGASSRRCQSARPAERRKQTFGFGVARLTGFSTVVSLAFAGE